MQVISARDNNGQFDHSKSFRYMKDVFKDADLSILNLETTLT